MIIYFTEELIKALQKKKAKSPVIKDTDYVYNGKEIDSKYLLPADYALIKRTVKAEKFWAEIKNKRVYRKLTALEGLQGAGGKKIKKLELLAEAIRQLIKPKKRKWIFLADKDWGTVMPYFVTSIKFHKRKFEGGMATQAYVSISLLCIARGKDESSSITFHKEDMGGSAAEVLARSEVLVETAKLIEEYEADHAVYQKIAPHSGEQFLARGTGIVKEEDDEKDEEDSWRRSWGRDKIQFEKDGEPSKVIMDDGLGRGDDTGYYTDTFWAGKASTDGDDDDYDGDGGEGEGLKLPLHPIVRVFSLGTHEYADCHVGNLEPYVYDPDVVHKLILPADHRELIDVLTGSAIRKMSDVVKGKARGVIILCSGKPGTGKTLTAEVYSEAAKRPLYMVQCSQLGTDEEELEKKLTKVLERANRWQAILLIDEADVYIHERGSDVQQNAIVGVFLRLLEYYNGILFMNTNRVTVVDDAILSRATAHIKYDVPKGNKERKAIWSVLAAQYNIKEFNIPAAIEAFPDISGRSMRQLLRMAKTMAEHRGKKVTVSMLQWAAKFLDFTERDEA